MRTGQQFEDVEVNEQGGEFRYFQVIKTRFMDATGKVVAVFRAGLAALTPPSRSATNKPRSVIVMPSHTGRVGSS
jgi:hypothetical protein